MYIMAILLGTPFFFLFLLLVTQMSNQPIRHVDMVEMTCDVQTEHLNKKVI